MLKQMNSEFSGLAEIEYGDGDFSITRPGAYVLCAETGKQIELRNLCYWSVDLQEAYINGEAATTRWKSIQAKK